MSSFQDAAGRRWELNVNPTTMKRVKSLAGFDLGKALTDEDQMQQLNSDIVLLVDIVYAICQPQAEKADVTDESFGEAMVGDAFPAMVTALMEAIKNFFPSKIRHEIEAETRKQRTETLQMEQREAG